MKRNSVFAAVCGAAAANRLLSAGTLLCAAASEVLDELPWGPEPAQVRVRLQKALWEAEELIVAAKEEEE